MTNATETRVVDTPMPFLSLPNVYDCVVGDYITYATRVERTTMLAWGRLQEDTSRDMNRFFVQNELDGSMLYHYFSDKIDTEAKLAYRLPDAEANTLMRNMPSRSVKEMLGLYEDRDAEDAKFRDIFGTPIQKGDLVTVASTWMGLKLGQVESVINSSYPIKIQTIEKHSTIITAPSNMVCVVPVSRDTIVDIRTMNPLDIYLHYKTRLSA
jgi:hypothetical protein